MKIRYHVHRLGGMSELASGDMDFETISSCPVCSSSAIELLAQLQGSLCTSLCRDCRHVFHSRRPTAAWLQRWYKESWDRSTDTATEQSLVREIRTRLRSAKGSLLGKFDSSRGRDTDGTTVFDFCRPVVRGTMDVLDVGCGYGNELLPFVRRGARCFGIEASPHRALAASRLGIRTSNIPVESLTAETFGRRFDLVFANHVLEHAHDPHVFLDAVSRVLKPGGWVCLTVPNITGGVLLQDFFFALHPHVYSSTSLTRLLALRGYSTERALIEHQLRFLARPSRSENAKSPSLAFVSSGAAVESGNWVEATLGDVTDDGATHFCGWQVAKAPRTRQVYEMIRTVEAPPTSERVVAYRCSGSKTLPLEFLPDDGKSRSHPWVK